MGKKRSVIIGSPEEGQLKAKKAVKLKQKKLRGGLVVDKTGQPLKAATTTAESTPPTPSQPRPAAKSVKPPKARSRVYRLAKSQVDSAKLYNISEAFDLLRKISYSKLNDTVELHLGLKAKPASELKVTLPHTAGKAKKITVVSDAVLKQIETGHLDFDILVASPADMPKLVKFAKVLGPKGLMPNPKSGTISDDPAAAAKKLATDTSTTLKLDKSQSTSRQAAVIHTTVGKLSLTDHQLTANVAAIIAATSQTGLVKAILKSTMSPAIKLACP